MPLNESLPIRKNKPHETLSPHLRGARIAIAAAVLQVLTACGGKAVVDHVQESGQGGSAGSENVGGTGGDTSPGELTISRNGALDEITTGEKGVRVAQFELMAGTTGAIAVDQLNFSLNGSCNKVSAPSFSLYVQGGSEPVAHFSALTSDGKLALTFSEPYIVDKGDSEVFYMQGDINCSCASELVTFVADDSDVIAHDLLYNAQPTVHNEYDGADPNGVPGDSDDRLSYLSIKGSNHFTVVLNGPADNTTAWIGDNVSCFDMTITNCTGNTVEARDWEIDVDVTPSTSKGGLVKEVSGELPLPNFTSIAMRDGNGSVVLGPSEINPNGNDALQTVVLNGLFELAHGETQHVSVTTDIAVNSALDGEHVRCTLKNLATPGKGFIQDMDGNELTETTVTPSTDVIANDIEIKAPTLLFDLHSLPSSTTYVSGQSNVDLLGITIQYDGPAPLDIHSLTIQGCVDGDAATLHGWRCSGAELLEDGGAYLRDIVDSLGLYKGGVLVSDTKEVNAVDSRIIFNNLNISVPPASSFPLILRGTLNNAAPYGSQPDRVKFGAFELVYLPPILGPESMLFSFQDSHNWATPGWENLPEPYNHLNQVSHTIVSQ